LLLKPSSSTDLRGGGATILCVCDVVALFVVCRPGRGGRSGERSWPMECRGGSEGLAGTCGDFDRLGGSVMLGTTLVLFIAFRVALSFSSGCLFGGKGGRFAGSNTGARTWYIVPLPLLVPVLLESIDRWDMLEAIVEIDSVDSLRLRLRLLDGLRGGRVGVCRGVPLLLVELCRGGGRGGRAGDGDNRGLSDTMG
jgi:hypothetical protein